MEYRYAGFWIRVLASLIDTVFALIITIPLLYIFFGEEYFQQNPAALQTTGIDAVINYVIVPTIIILFWLYRSATPGKMLLHLKIIRTDGNPQLTVGQSIGRYLAYFLSGLPLMLGFIWVAFDARKQGWHDKLAGTLVVYDEGK